MFIHLYKSRLKCLLKDKYLLFWSFLWPIILSTLFYAGFGDGTKINENMDTIPVAFVSKETSDEEQMLFTTMNSINYSEDKKLFEVTKVTKEEADTLLKEKKVDGIVEYSDKLQLIVSKSDIPQSIIKSFIDQYQQTVAIIGEISTKSPEKLTTVLDSLMKESTALKEISLSGSDTNGFIQYYYALIAMTCLFGSFYGLKNFIDTQANLSVLGARRSVTPTHKMTLIIADTFAALTLHFLEIVLVFVYLRFVLNISIGDQLALFFLCCFIGCVLSVTAGQFVGAVSKAKETVKQAILTTVTLSLCFFSGLMVSGMKDIIEKNLPIFNRINPAALLTDAFYCLSVYDDYTRFTTNLVTLTIIAILFCGASFLVTRRMKYASI